MKEIRRLRPGTDNALYADYQKTVRQTALELLEPCKGHGRAHLASMIGRFVFEQHNEMTEICGGIKKGPMTADERVEFSIKTAAAGLLVGAIIKMVEDPNTQWDSDTLFYYQLRNHFESLQAHASAAMVITLPGGN